MIHTKFHILMDIFNDGNTTPMDDPEDDRIFHSLAEFMSHQPKYFMTDEVVEMALSPAGYESLQAMYELGINRLPYEPLVVELSGWLAPCRAFVLLQAQRVLAPTKKMNHMFGWKEPDPALVAGSLDENGEFWSDIVANVLLMALKRKREDATVDVIYGVRANYLVKTGAPGRTHLSTMAVPMPQFFNAPNDLDIKFGEIGLYAVKTALKSALLSMNTLGVDAEVVSCEALNKARAHTGRAPIPTHAVMHINRNFRRLGHKSAEIGGEPYHVRPHLRAGHIRQQVFGPRIEPKHKPIFIPPTVVNFRQGEAPVLPARELRL